MIRYMLYVSLIILCSLIYAFYTTFDFKKRKVPDNLRDANDSVKKIKGRFFKE